MIAKSFKANAFEKSDAVNLRLAKEDDEKGIAFNGFETSFLMGAEAKSYGLDTKPSDLSMARLKQG